MQKIDIREINRLLLNIQKEILDLGEFRYRKNTKDFLFYKRNVMRIMARERDRHLKLAGFKPCDCEYSSWVNWSNKCKRCWGLGWYISEDLNGQY